MENLLQYAYAKITCWVARKNDTISCNDVNIVKYGNGNNYPQVIEALISTTPSALKASSRLASFLKGKGVFEDVKDKRKKERLIAQIAHDLSYYRGFAVHVMYNTENKVADYEYLPFKNCRLQKKTDNNKVAKVLYSDDWVKKEEPKDFYLFNPSVVQEQKNAEQENAKDKDDYDPEIDYKGQVYYYSADPHTEYPRSWIHAIAQDCDTERAMHVHLNRFVSNGFKDVQIAFFQSDNTGESDEEKEQLTKETNNITKMLQELTGVDGANGTLVIGTKDLNDLPFKIQTLESVGKFDKQLTVLDKAESIISSAFANIPLVLIQSPDSSMFSASGESYKTACLIFQNELDYLYKAIEGFFIDIEQPLTIVRPYKDESETETTQQ